MMIIMIIIIPLSFTCKAKLNVQSFHRDYATVLRSSCLKIAGCPSWRSPRYCKIVGSLVEFARRLPHGCALRAGSGMCLVPSLNDRNALTYCWCVFAPGSAVSAVAADPLCAKIRNRKSKSSAKSTMAAAASPF